MASSAALCAASSAVGVGGSGSAGRSQHLLPSVVSCTARIAHVVFRTVRPDQLPTGRGVHGGITCCRSVRARVGLLTVALNRTGARSAQWVARDGAGGGSMLAGSGFILLLIDGAGMTKPGLGGWLHGRPGPGTGRSGWGRRTTGCCRAGCRARCCGIRPVSRPACSGSRRRAGCARRGPRWPGCPGDLAVQPVGHRRRTGVGRGRHSLAGRKPVRQGGGWLIVRAKSSAAWFLYGADTASAIDAPAAASPGTARRPCCSASACPARSRGSPASAAAPHGHR